MAVSYGKQPLARKLKTAKEQGVTRASEPEPLQKNGSTCAPRTVAMVVKYLTRATVELALFDQSFFGEIGSSTQETVRLGLRRSGTASLP